jgi:hypothetical protein
METLTTDPTVASKLAEQHFEAAVEAGIDGGRTHPQGALFIGSDAPHLGATLVRAAREFRPVVIVYPDGEERVVRFDAPGWSWPMPATLRDLRGYLQRRRTRTRTRTRTRS